jgi:ABC-type sugar transport system permease subunit
MLYSLWLSFCRYEVISPPEFIGLCNYIYLFLHDPSF